MPKTPGWTYRIATAVLVVTIMTAPVIGQPPPPPFYQSVAWSPDGSRLVTAAVLDSWESGYALYVVRLDGSGLEKLDTGGGRQPLYPVFSPNGQRISFGMQRDGAYGIWEIGAAGDTLRLLFSAPRAGAPSYSPDGSRVTYHAVIDSVRQVMVANADGSSARRVSSGQGNYNPQWSPDGRLILYYSSRAGGGANDTIYVATADGSDERKVTRGVFPTWTPDGRILLTSNDNGESSLYIVNVDGSERRRIAHGVVYAAMSPDGRSIAAVTYTRPGDRSMTRYYIEIMQPDGSGRRRITPH